MASNQSFPMPCRVGVKLRHACFLFSLFFIICMNWIDKCNQLMSVPRSEIAKSVTWLVQMIWFCPHRIWSSATLNSFTAACDTARMKISTVKSQNKYTSCFKKPQSVLVAREKTSNEAGIEVQVSWGCIHEWRKARRRTGYPNWQRNCNNASFAQFSCCETSIVEKLQSSQFSKQSFSPFSPTEYLYMIMNLR